MNDGGSADCGAVRVMEVVWPSGIALRGAVSNHCAPRPLTAVRGERHRKRRAMSASGVVWEDGWKYLSLTRRNPFQSTSKPGPAPRPGRNLGVTRLLPRWCPAYRQHESGPGSRTEHVKARLDTVTEQLVARGRTPSGRNRKGLSTGHEARWRTGP